MHPWPSCSRRTRNALSTSMSMNWSTKQGHETVNSWGQEVKGQDHTRPKLDLEAWRRFRSRTPYVEYSFSSLSCFFHHCFIF